MRILRFKIDGQIISKDTNCNFDNIVPGTTGYLKAEFSFSTEWNGFTKVAAFYSNGRECPEEVLKDGKSGIIPTEALVGRRFSIKIVGMNKKTKTKITTNTVEVVQNGG